MLERSIHLLRPLSIGDCYPRDTKEKETREDEGREQIPHTQASIFGYVSYCVVIIRKAPHWSVRMTSCNFRLLTSSQHGCELIINFK